jgi:hypothetical protein
MMFREMISISKGRKNIVEVKVKVQAKECHSEPFGCHSDPERREGEESRSLTQGRLHEESPPAIAVRWAGQRSFVLLRMTPQPHP